MIRLVRVAAQLAGELEEGDGGEACLLPLPSASRLPFGVNRDERRTSQCSSQVSELGRVGRGDEVDFEGLLVLQIHDDEMLCHCAVSLFSSFNGQVPGWAKMSTNMGPLVTVRPNKLVGLIQLLREMGLWSLEGISSRFHDRHKKFNNKLINIRRIYMRYLYTKI